MPALRPRERRLLVLAGLLGIGVAGYVYVVEPLIETHAATRELVVARRGLLVRQERLVARSEAYGRELGALRAEIARRRGRLLAGDKAPVAAARTLRSVSASRIGASSSRWRNVVSSRIGPESVTSTGTSA